MITHPRFHPIGILPLSPRELESSLRQKTNFVYWCNYVFYRPVLGQGGW